MPVGLTAAQKTKADAKVGLVLGAGGRTGSWWSGLAAHAPADNHAHQTKPC